MSKERQTTERRKYIRVKSDIITWKKADISGYENNFIFGSFKINNIGGGGICFESSTDVPVKTLLNMKFALPKRPQIEASGKVIWTKKLKNAKFDLGVEFTKILNDDQKCIIDFCQNKLEKKWYNFLKK